MICLHHINTTCSTHGLFEHMVRALLRPPVMFGMVSRCLLCCQINDLLREVDSISAIPCMPAFIYQGLQSFFFSIRTMKSLYLFVFSFYSVELHCQFLPNSIRFADFRSAANRNRA